MLKIFLFLIFILKQTNGTRINKGKSEVLLLALIQHNPESNSVEPLPTKGLVIVNDRYVLDHPIQISQFSQEENDLISWWSPSNKTPKQFELTSSLNDRYNLDNRFNFGGQGEVWYAHDYQSGHRFVLKRIFDSKITSGMREAQFGQILKGEARMSRFIEYFHRFSFQNELWLVFEDEGTSLKDYLYNTDVEGKLKRSSFWEKIRESGMEIRREICRQLVLGLNTLHSKFILHRDIKPSNIFINTIDSNHVKLGDFGSAIFFGFKQTTNNKSFNLTRQDHSVRYEPPEFKFMKNDLQIKDLNSTFDSWSLGVLLLEVLLGNDQVFELNQQQKRNLLKKNRMSTIYDELLEFGLGNITTFNISVKNLDILGEGFLNDEELAFVFNLLQLNPNSRMTMEQALEHPYLSEKTLNSKFICTQCDRKFSTFSGCLKHIKARNHSSPYFDLACKAIGEISCSLETGDSPMWCGNSGYKNYNEDYFFHKGNLVIVSDGHLGSLASRRIPSLLAEENLNKSNLEDSFFKVNQKFLLENPEDSSGAALTVAIFSNGELTVGNVGDVRSFVCCDSKGKAIVMTQDHLASNPKEEELVKKRGGFVKYANGRARLNGILALTRAFGDRNLPVSVEPDVMSLNYSKSIHEFLIIATDGVTDVISNEDIITICKFEKKKNEKSSWFTIAAKRIVLEAKKRELSLDNLGVAVIPIPLEKYL